MTRDWGSGGKPKNKKGGPGSPGPPLLLSFLLSLAGDYGSIRRGGLNSPMATSPTVKKRMSTPLLTRKTR